MNWKRAAIVALLIVPIFVVLAAGFGTDPHAVPFVLQDKPAPAFSLRTLDGKTVDLESLKGKPTLINFWATWCEPCKVEHELIQSAARYYEGQANFIGVVYQDERDAVRRYLTTRTNRIPQCLDDNSKTAIDFGVAGVPESFILDADGVVRYKRAGVLTKAIIESELVPLFKDGGA